MHKPAEFVAKVLPLYFQQSKLTSFQRQLNLYRFNRVTTGRDRGGYYHELFLRDRLWLCQGLPRVRVKGHGIKPRASPETEPDFYAMSWVAKAAGAATLADVVAAGGPVLTVLGIFGQDDDHPSYGTPQTVS